VERRVAEPGLGFACAYRINAARARPFSRSVVRPNCRAAGGQVSPGLARVHVRGMPLFDIALVVAGTLIACAAVGAFFGWRL